MQLLTVRNRMTRHDKPQRDAGAGVSVRPPTLSLGTAAGVSRMYVRIFTRRGEEGQGSSRGWVKRVLRPPSGPDFKNQSATWYAGRLFAIKISPVRV